MALISKVSDIHDNENLCYERFTGSQEDMQERVSRVTFMGPDWNWTDSTKTSIIRLSVTTHCLIFASMSVAMGSITDKNAKEFFTRLSMLETAFGAFRRDEEGKATPFTFNEVKAHIGLRTNVSEEANAAFSKRLASNMRRDAVNRMNYAASA